MISLDFTRLGGRRGWKIVASIGSGESFTTRADLLDEEQREKAIEQILSKFPAADRAQIEDALEAEAAREEPKSDKVADALLQHVCRPEVAELFHSPEFEPFALVRVAASVTDGQARHETLHVPGPAFRHWLMREAFDRGYKALNSETVQMVTNSIAAQARFAGPKRRVFVRVGEHDGAVFLDLCDEERSIVRVTREGWKVLPANKVPVRMVRARGMLALPTPEKGGSIDELRPFLNVDDRQWILVRGFLIGMFRPRGPHAALVLTAEHGCGKSWTAEVLRELVDPNVLNNRRPPKDERDLAIATRNSHVISLNNLSGLSPWLSDALCSMLDGGGMATRELHTDANEVIFAGARPAILNGIEDVATRPDLADRAIHLDLRRMSESALKSEDDLRTAFRMARPRILGALLDAVVCALHRVEQVHLDRKPRRLDFAKWVEAAAPALGLQRGEFLSAYVENRDGASAVALESSPFAQAVRDRIERSTTGEWKGSATELLAEVTIDETKKHHGWPANPRKAASVLRAFAPCLRANGIGVDDSGQDSKSRRTIYRLWRIEVSRGSPERSQSEDPSHENGSDGAATAVSKGAKLSKDLFQASASVATSTCLRENDVRTDDPYDRAEREAIQSEGLT